MIPAVAEQDHGRAAAEHVRGMFVVELAQAVADVDAARRRLSIPPLDLESEQAPIARERCCIRTSIYSRCIFN